MMVAKQISSQQHVKYTKEEVVFVIEEGNDVIGYHSACQINDRYWLPMLTVFEFLYTKLNFYYQSGSGYKYLAKTAYFTRVTYKPSAMKKQSQPSTEFITMIKRNDHQRAAQYLH